MKNKKGVMVKFLVTILIALIVFVPTVMFVSKIIGSTSQGENNFIQFVNKIKEFSKSGEGKEKFLLILDSETAIVGFTDSKFQTCLSRGGKEDCETWNRPKSSACKSGGCVCLLKELVRKSEKELLLPRKVDYKTFTCLNTGDIKFGVPKMKTGPRDKPYEIIAKNGFLVGRDIKKSAFFTKPFEFTGRRNTVYFLNKNNLLFVCHDSQCKELDFTYAAEKTEEEPIPFS